MTPEDEELVFSAADASQITQPDAVALRQFLDVTGADREALLALRRAMPGPVPAIDRIAVPCLVLTGDADGVVGPPDPWPSSSPPRRSSCCRAITSR